MSKNVVTFQSGSEVTQGHRKLYHSADRFLLVFFSNFVPKTHRFWDIQLLSIQWPWNPVSWSLRVIGTVTCRSATYDFLLTFQSNHGMMGLSSTVSEINGDFSRKSQNFPTPMHFAPRWVRGSPWNWRSKSKKLEWWGYQIVKKVLSSGLSGFVKQGGAHLTSQVGANPITIPTPLMWRYLGIK